MKFKPSKLSQFASSILLCLGLFTVFSQAQALPLNLTLNPSPDIESGFTDVVYNSSSQTLTMSGFTLTLFDGAIQHNIAGNDVFSLTASIDNSGNFLSGSVLFGGDIAALGFTSGLLLEGNLTSFGFNINNDILEFTFDATGGEALSLYSGTGGLITSDTGFGGVWNQNWDNNSGFSGFGLSASDAGVVASVSAPMTLWLLTGGIGLLGIARRYRVTT